MIDRIVEYDKIVFKFLNGINSPLWNDIMWWISDNLIWIPLYFVLLVMIIYRDFSFRSVFTVLFVVAAVALSDQISGLIKFLVERPRPSHYFSIDEIHLLKNPDTGEYYKGGAFGFVSSHAANVFCAAAFLTNHFKGYKWGLFLFGWATVVSYSRIYLGVHYPLDIIFGALIGALIGIQFYVFKVRTSVFFERKIEIRKDKKLMALKLKQREESKKIKNGNDTTTKSSETDTKRPE